MAYDQYYGNVSLLLHGDGSDGSTTFTDNSPAPLTPTVNGNAKISTSQSKFGGSSMCFDGTGDYLNYANQSAFALGPGDFTIEFYVYYNVLNIQQDLVSFTPSDGSGLYPDISTTSGNKFQYYANGASRITGTTTIADKTWYHLAVCRSGTATKLFVNGVQEGSTYSDSNSYTVGTNRPTIGGGGWGQTTPLNGYIDDLRITKGTARYTANFTPETSAFPDSANPALAEFGLNLPSLQAYGFGAANSSISLPSLLAASSGGAISNSALPSLTISSRSGAGYAGSIPGITAAARGHNSTGEQAAALSLPSMSVSARGGANTKLSLSSLSSQAAGTVTASASANLVLSSLSAIAAATVAGSGRTALSLPSLGGKSYAGALCSVTIGALSLKATGTMGAIGMAKVMLPLFEVVSVATAQNHGSAHLTLPSLQMGGSARAPLTLPGLELVAIGTAVVAATYEAYAINLLQPLDQSPSNQYDAKVPAATHYTNFPFTHVVRYKNSYYGANSTGLYLLEGTTDNGTPIPFAVKTCETDFGAPEIKTVESAYLAGRLGNAATVTLFAREDTTNAQAFTTPRSAKPQSHRQVFSRGLKARYFALGISGSKEFELDTVDFSVGTTKRRL